MDSSLNVYRTSSGEGPTPDFMVKLFQILSHEKHISWQNGNTNTSHVRVVVGGVLLCQHLRPKNNLEGGSPFPLALECMFRANAPTDNE